MKKITKLLVLSSVMLLGACGGNSSEDNTSKEEPSSSLPAYEELDKAAVQGLIEAIPADCDLDYVSARQVLKVKDYETKALFFGHEDEFFEMDGDTVDYYAYEDTYTYVNTKYDDEVIEQYTGYVEYYLDDLDTPYEEYEYVDLMYMAEDETWGEVFTMNEVYLTEGYEDYSYTMGVPADYLSMLLGYETFDEFLADCYYGYSVDGTENFFCKDEAEGYVTSIEGKLYPDGSWEATYSYETTLLYSEYDDLDEEEIDELVANPEMKEYASYSVKFENNECVYAEAKDEYFISGSPFYEGTYDEPQFISGQYLVTDEMKKEAGNYDGGIELVAGDVTWLFE